MAEPLTAPKGTYDVLPDQQPLRRWVVRVAEEIFARYGYRRIDTPLFEDTRLFARGVGEHTDIVRKEMYTFTDLGGRSMTLRPEGTAPVARAYIEHGMHTWPQPVKLYYYSPMFRYESPQAGRYRQHYQLGVEAFGSSAPELDAEVIGLLAALYRELGLERVDLHLNSLGCADCRPRYSALLRSFLEANAASLCAECRVRSHTNPLRTFDCKVESCRALLTAAPHLSDHLCPDCLAHHERVKAYLQLEDLSYTEDPTLVRGMDYYTRTTFEFQCALLGAQSGVGGGGRYDDLVSAIGGPAVPGVGFGTGVERILLALERSGVSGPDHVGPVVYLVALVEAARPHIFRLAHELRQAGLGADLDYMNRSPKGQMKQAGRSGARLAFILGEEELAAQSITVRDLASGEERRISRNAALEFARATGQTANGGRPGAC